MRLLRLRASTIGLALAALLAPVGIRAQAPESSLTGQLLDQTTRAPIRAGVVELTRPNRRVLTDTMGRFVFTKVPAGRYVVLASALGYRKTVGPAETGSPAVILLPPEPVPLAAIEALAQPSRRSVRGIPYWVFGRDQLLAGPDITAAEFVRWKVPMAVRPCHTFDWGPTMTTALRRVAAEEGATLAPAATETPFHEPPPDGMFGQLCIYGARGRPGPFMVLLDGQPLQYSDELWAHRSWDLGRVEVTYQRAPSAAAGAPFAMVRLYTVGYLARVAARTGGICGRLNPSNSGSALADSALAALCGP